MDGGLGGPGGGGGRGEAEPVVDAFDLQRVGDRVGRIDQVAVRGPVERVGEHPVRPPDVDVAGLQAAVGGVRLDRVECLLVLAPVGVSDEALVVDDDPQAAKRGGEQAARRLTQLQPADLGDVRIADYRILGQAVDGGVVANRAEVADV
jgi:hypothetical protein